MAALPLNPGIGATDILKEMPTTLGADRSDAVCRWVERGAVPYFLRNWLEVHHKEGDDEITFYCLPDFLCLGTDANWVYCPMGALTAERVARMLGASLVTPKMVDIIYAASCRQVAQPWGEPYDSSMTGTSRWPTQTKKVQNASTFRTGVLVEGHMKNVCISKKMENKKGEWLSFYGWFQANGQPIQGNNVNAHGAEYADYAHGVRLALMTTVVNGEMSNITKVLTDPNLHHLLEPEGVMEFGSYQATRSHFGVTSVQY